MKRFLTAALVALCLPLSALGQEGSKLTDKTACADVQSGDLLWLVRGSTTDLKCPWSVVGSSMDAFASDPANCSTGQYPLGIAADGSVQSCTAAPDLADAAPWGEYDFTNPAGCAADVNAVCDEWTGDAAALTWAWGNQGSAAESITRGGAYLTGDTTDAMHVRWTDPPLSGNTDMVVSAIIRFDTSAMSTTGDGCGIAILHGGTTASPTDIATFYWVNATTDGFSLSNWSNYSTISFISSTGSSIADTEGLRYVVQLRYTDSTRVTTAFYGRDNDLLYTSPGSSKTLSGDPIKIGYFVRRNGACFVESFRAQTDNTSTYKVGD